MYKPLDSSLNDEILDRTPCHSSTPKYHMSPEDHLTNGNISEGEADTDSQFENYPFRYSTTLNSFLTDLHHKKDLSDDQEFVMKRCSSVMSESSKDSGRHTDSPLQNVLNSASVVELIKELSLQVQKLEGELRFYKGNESLMKSNMEKLKNEMETLQNHRRVQTNNASVIEENLKREVTVWKDYCNQARQEIEDLKNDKMRLEKDLIIQVEKEKSWKQEVARSNKTAAEISKEEAWKNSVVERQNLQRRLILPLKGFKMLLEKQQAILNTCFASLPSTELEEYKKELAHYRQETNVLASNFEASLRNFCGPVEVDSFPGSLNNCKQDKEIKAASHRTQTKKASSKSVSRASKARSSRAIDDEVSNRQSMEKFTRLLTMVQEIDTRVSLYEHS